MIKTGIINIKNMLHDKGTTCFRKELKNISITLYDQILGQPNAEELAERLLFLCVDERGVYKRTYTKRFEEFDNAVVNFLQQHFIDPKLSLFIRDVGVSDGRTSIDFFAKVSCIFPDVKFNASDYSPKVYILEKGKLKVAISHTDKLLEITYPPFVFNVIKLDSYLYYPLNHIMRFIIKYFMVTPLLKTYKLGNIQARELLLFSPTVLNLAKQDQRFNLSQHNLLLPFNEQSNIIRVMNLLNPCYFKESEFNCVLKNIYSGLLENGLFIIGSNQEAGTLVHGGIYQKRNNHFKKLWRSGNGSAINQKILNYTPCQDTYKKVAMLN